MALIKLSLLFFCILLQLAVMMPKTSANLAVFDEYLQKKANESYEAVKAFDPNPEALTDEFNQLVGETLTSDNTTRRELRGKGKRGKGKRGNGCQGINSIDKCWRCDPNWANDRKRLADCARGFGHDTSGGKNGNYYLVTDPSDDSMDNPRPGTLRHAVIQPEPLWIIFAHSCVIKLRQELIMTSDKTIDGRGAQVHIAYGAGITIQFVSNIIIHNIWIHDIVRAPGGMIRDSINHIGQRGESDGDAINIYGSSHLWIDHVSLSKASDGLIDVIQGSTAITISNCKFNHHNDVMLLGAHETDSMDANMQVTIAYNRFGIGCIQRMPRVRWGFAHVVNNDYSHWELYAIGGSAHPTIISQGNRFKAADYRYTKEVTKRDYASPDMWMQWQWRSEGDVFLNGAFFTESGPPLNPVMSPLTGQNLIPYMPGTEVGMLTRDAGALKCRPGKFC